MLKVEYTPGTDPYQIEKGFSRDSPPPEINRSYGEDLLKVYREYGLVMKFGTFVIDRDMTVNDALGNAGERRNCALTEGRAWLGPYILETGLMLHGVGIWEPVEQQSGSV